MDLRLKDRNEWIRELERRQDNIDPIRRIPNYALFQGSLIKGNLRLSGVQRIGALLVGLYSLLFAGYSTFEVIEALHPGGPKESLLEFLLWGIFSWWIGWKITMNVLLKSGKNRSILRH